MTSKDSSEITLATKTKINIKISLHTLYPATNPVSPGTNRDPGEKNLFGDAVSGDFLEVDLDPIRAASEAAS